jgi:hypothetical protein
VGNSEHTLFWEDPWLDGLCIGDRAPDLVAAMSARCRHRRTVTHALANNAWIRDMSGALSILVLMQYLHLRARLVDVQLDHATTDKMIWRWTSSDTYLSSSAYAAFFHGQTVLGGTKEVWRTKAPREHKFFLWLAIQDRCWTLEHRRRHGLTDCDDCALCG